MMHKVMMDNVVLDSHYKVDYHKVGHIPVVYNILCFRLVHNIYILDRQYYNKVMMDHHMDLVDKVQFLVAKLYQ